MILEIIKKHLPFEDYDKLPLILDHLWTLEFEENDKHLIVLIEEITKKRLEYDSGECELDYLYYMDLMEYEIRSKCLFDGEGFSFWLAGEVANIIDVLWVTGSFNMKTD